MKKIVCLSAVIVFLSAALVSCGAKKETTSDAKASNAYSDATSEATAAEKTEVSDFTGKWQCKNITIDGTTEDNLWGADAFTLFQIELGEENKGTFLSFLFSEGDTPDDITWELKDDGSVVLKGESEIFADDDFIITKDGDGLILDLSDEMSEFKAALEKVDEFKEIPEDTGISFSFSGEAEGEWNIELDGSDVSVTDITTE